MQGIEASVICGRCVALDARWFPEGGDLGGWCFLHPTYDFWGIGLDLRVASIEAARVAIIFGARLQVQLTRWDELEAVIRMGGGPGEVHEVLRDEALMMAEPVLERLEGCIPQAEDLAKAYEDREAHDAYNRNRTTAIVEKDGSSWGFLQHLTGFLKDHPRRSESRDFHHELFQEETRVSARHLDPDHAPFPARLRLRQPLPSEVPQVQTREDLTGHFLSRLHRVGPRPSDERDSFVDPFSGFSHPESVRALAVEANTGKSPRDAARHAEILRDRGWGDQVPTTPGLLAEISGIQQDWQAVADAKLDSVALADIDHPGINILREQAEKELTNEEIAARHGRPPKSLPAIRKGARAFLALVNAPDLLSHLPSRRGRKQALALSSLAKGKTMPEVARLLGLGLREAEDLVLKASSLLFSRLAEKGLIQ